MDSGLTEKSFNIIVAGEYTGRNEIMTSKQRSYLKSIAMTTEPILQIGKSSLTPEFTQSVSEALEARELIKISVLQN